MKEKTHFFVSHHKNLRSSRLEVYCKKDVLRNFAKFTGKHPCQSVYFNKVAQVFSCEFCEVSKNTFLNRTSSVAASVHKTKDIKKNVKQKIDEKF